MSKKIPYTPPRLVEYEPEADCPDRIRDIVQSLRQHLEVPHFKVAPQYFAGGGQEVRRSFR